MQVQINSSITGDQETVTLTPDAVQPGSFKASIKILAYQKQRQDGILQASVAAQDEIVVRYRDLRTDSGTPADVQTTAQLVREKVIFADSCENGNQGWLATGTWSLTAEKAASGTRAWSDSLGSNYAHLSQVTLTSPLFDLRGLSDVKVQFAHAHENEITDAGWTTTRALSFSSL